MSSVSSSPELDSHQMESSLEKETNKEPDESSGLNGCEIVTLDDSDCVNDNAAGNVSADAAPDSSILVDDSLTGTLEQPTITLDSTDPLDESTNLEAAATTPASPENAPVFRLAFRDEKTFRKYHKKIKDFLTHLIQNDEDEVMSATNDLVLEIFDSSHSNEHVVSNDKDKEFNDFLFTLDTKPQQLKDDLDVPVYGKKFNKALDATNDEVPETKDKYTAPKMTCFNCLGNHSLRDCPEPRNNNAIIKNRKDYFNVRRGSGFSNSRYHLEDEQKFGHFVPGQISTSLQKALGLKENELPRHIYRMRMLGYPPGWLEEAKLQHSGLALFNSEGVADGGSDEEGEIVSPGDKDQYDVRKIIDFPGFNVFPPQGIRDDYVQYWGSVEQENYSKTAMVAFLSHKQVEDGYKRKKLPNPHNVKVNYDIKPGEMELDTVEDTSFECVPVQNLFIPPLPKEDDCNLPPPPPPPPQDSEHNKSLENSNNSDDAQSSRDVSPTLVDLENAKSQLLAELNNSQTQSNPDSIETKESESSSSNKLNDSDCNNTNNPNLESLQTKSSDDVEMNSETPKSSPKPTLGSAHKSIKVVHLGTPILNSCSPYRRLPSSEKFSKDICDVINFENLPDSTGKYDQMTELLQKVRRTLSDLHKE